MTKKFIASFTLFSFMSLSVPVIAAPQSADALSQAGVAIESSSGDIVNRGDSIRTGAESEMTLLLPSGTRVKVAPNSEFRVTKDQAGNPEVYLLSGRVMTAAQGPVKVKTYRSSAVASKGEFILETNPEGTGLRVLSGNAKLSSQADDAVAFNRLNSLPDSISNGAALAFDNLSSDQTIGNFEFGAQGKGKGKGQGIRDGTSEESTSGVGDVSPDQDMVAPGEEAVVETPPETPPVADTPPPTTPPTTTPTTTPTVAGGGGPIWPYILGGLGLAGIIIAIASDSDSDDPVLVPSPSLP